MKVIILNGVALSGKDTFSDYFSNHAKENNEIAYKLSTVDKVKDMCYYLFQADPSDKSNKNRKLWCDFKNMWTEFNDGPFTEINKTIRDSDGDYYLVMCRESSEIQKFKDFYGQDCFTILIRRDGLQVPDNTADQEVEDFEYDYYFYNKSLEYLDKKAKELHHKLYGLEVFERRILTKQELKTLEENLKNSYKDFKKYENEMYGNFNKKEKK